MKKLPHIGTIELVSLPYDQIQNVPAKIDTGADSSAIWASELELKRGKLAFKFFAPGSAYYTGEKVITTAYKTTSVKSSFGHEEFRYKIRLQIAIGEHRLTRWFSLADRSRNTYPVLLGKNVLKHRFVVDVARKYIVSPATANKVLVLGGQPELTSEFFARVSQFNQQSVEYDCAGYNQLYFQIEGSSTRITDIQSGLDVADYSLVYFKSRARDPEYAAAIAEYLRYKNRPYIDSEAGEYVSGSKLTEYMRLACHGLPLPAAVCAKPSVLAGSFKDIVGKFGRPFVLKEFASDQGRNNYLVESEKDFKAILKKTQPGESYIAQQYIPNDGFLRLYVLGKEVPLVIKRTGTQHKHHLKRHLNKPAGSHNASVMLPPSVPGEASDIALRAAVCMKRQVAGVDILQDKASKKWYILEVNSAPQIRSGSYTDEKARALAHYFDKELSK